MAQAPISSGVTPIAKVKLPYGSEVTTRAKTPILADTEHVLALIDEARDPERVVWPKIEYPRTQQEVDLNLHREMLLSMRYDHESPGVCVCNVSLPKVCNQGWWHPSHPNHKHACLWFHVFHCTRIQNTGYRVILQQLDWCECPACSHYAQILDDDVHGVYRINGQPYSVRGTAGTEEAINRPKYPGSGLKKRS